MALDQNALNSLRIERTAQPVGSSGPRVLPWVIAAIVVLSAGAAYALLRKGGIEVQTVQPTPAAGPPGAGTVLNASGYVVARRQATVSAKTTGKIEEVLVEEGMTVTEGQLLARLD